MPKPSPKKKQPLPNPNKNVGAMQLCPKCQHQTVHWMNRDAKLVCSGCGTGG